LIDLIAYMIDKNQHYPTIEMIARNIGCSSKSVERHVGELSSKSMILISQFRKNNTYFLPNFLHCHHYLLMSEKTHEFVGGVRKQVNERELTLWIQGIVKSEDYKAFTARLQRLHEDAILWINSLRRKHWTASSIPDDRVCQAISTRCKRSIILCLLLRPTLCPNSRHIAIIEEEWTRLPFNVRLRVSEY
jgi:hypothetical protein